MKYTYELHEDTSPITGEVIAYISRSDEAVIPCDPTNSDYQAYLRWLDDPTADDQPMNLL